MRLLRHLFYASKFDAFYFKSYTYQIGHIENFARKTLEYNFAQSIYYLYTVPQLHKLFATESDETDGDKSERDEIN